MPAFRKITESEMNQPKKRGRPVGSKNKHTPVKVEKKVTGKRGRPSANDTAPTPTYTWRCKNNHTQIVHIRMYDCLCGVCKQEMKCDDKKGILS